MKEFEQNMCSPLSLDDLENITGGVNVVSGISDNIIDGITDAEYMVIKQELDAAAADDDFNTFMAIVKLYAPYGGKPFLARVINDYTRTGFLSSSRFSEFTAEFVSFM